MKYEKIVRARFIERENRFVARVSLPEVPDQDRIRSHVKNTGRCKELLLPGVTIYLEDHIGRMDNRKYRFSLVAVEKNTKAGKKGDEHSTILINMDSQAPNKVIYEALKSGKNILGDKIPLDPSLTIKPEAVYGESRLDFFIERTAPGSIRDKGEIQSKAFLEVKGVTLEDDGVARFPDAPTERGIKHIRELERAVMEGYDAFIIFVIQMKGMKYFEPNDDTHPEFGEALRHAKANGVEVLAYDCKVTKDSLELDSPVDVRL